MQRVFHALCFAFLAVLAPADAVAGVTAPGASGYAYGYFCALEPVGELEAEGTISGTVSLIDGPPNFIRQGSLVPAQIGVGFGILFDVLPRYMGPVRVEVTHPPLGPNDVTTEVWISDLDEIRDNYIGFSFDLPYELREGRWGFRGTANGRLVFEAFFNVVDPGILPPVDCGLGALHS
ncbi:MAG: DUF3859 domain-containing protein [Rhodobacter sp.]|nr:DUF3859 domain-containing protein [Rhodobacter sp.]